MAAVHCFVNVAVIALLVALVGIWLQEGAEPVTERPPSAPPSQSCARDICSEGEGSESRLEGLLVTADGGVGMVNAENGRESLPVVIQEQPANVFSLDTPSSPPPPVPPPTSVFCWGSSHTDRLCHFRNLYYLPLSDEFVYLHGNEDLHGDDDINNLYYHYNTGSHHYTDNHDRGYDSASVGVPLIRHSPALVDLSSVADHNVAHFDYVDFTRAPVEFSTARVVEGNALMLRRFHPDNLMHVLHDDLMPIYHTLRVAAGAAAAFGGGGGGSKRGERGETQLVFVDDREPGPHADLYRMFSSLPPLYKSDLRSDPAPMRFASVLVGLSKRTTWYQYGFTEGRPQGPINGSEVTEADIRRFCLFFAAALNVTLSTESTSPAGDGAGGPRQRTVVLVRREDTRLILNDLELTLTLARRLQARVLTVAMETHSVDDMMRIISGADLMIGMHGSLLILAMFLPPHAALIELYPYAVPPARYTPYRTLALLCRLRYAPWRCVDRSRSVAHPERSPERGGLAHLSVERRREVEESVEVPPHRCCGDAEWLYRANQDTTVDVEAIVQLIETLEEPSPERAPAARWPVELVPSRVRDVKCSADPPGSYVGEGGALTVSWQAPINLEYLPDMEDLGVQYEVWLQEGGAEDYQAWMLGATSHRFDAGLRGGTDYHVWVRCVLGGGRAVGPFNARLTCRTAN